MRKLVDYKLVNKSDVYTSYKFNEYHHHFKNWYDAVPNFKYEDLVEISDKSGDVLLTSDYDFIEKLYVKFDNEKIERLYKEWEEVKKSIPEKKDDLNVIVKDLKDKEGLKKEIVEYFENKLIKKIEIDDNGEYILTLWVKKEQSNIPTDFKEFEKFFLKTYGLEGEIIPFIEAVWDIENRYPEIAKEHIKEINGIYVISKEGLELIKKEREKRIKKEKEELEKKAKEFLNNKLYKVKDEVKDKPFFYRTSLSILDNKELKKETEEYLDLLEDVVLVDSKAGSFYAKRSDKEWVVEVEDDKKGLFIGKGGKNIKELANKYNVKIKI